MSVFKIISSPKYKKMMNNWLEADGGDGRSSFCLVSKPRARNLNGMCLVMELETNFSHESFTPG